MIESKMENAFAEDAPMIFDERVLIDNYNAWERLFEIFVVNDRLDVVEKLAFRIVDALKRYEVPTVICKKTVATHDALLRTFHSALCRSLALMWGNSCDEFLEKLEKKVNELRFENDSLRFTEDTICSFSKTTMCATRRAYCMTRMVNKYVMPLPIDCVADQREFSDKKHIKLCKLDSGVHFDFNKFKNELYLYYP